MVSKLIIVRSRSSSLRITSQRNDELNRRKDPKSAPSNRERIFNKIEDRKDGLSRSLQEAVKMTETLTSNFHRERGNQQERHRQMEQRGETPGRLEKKLTRSEITRLVEYSLTMADPAMLQQALILESEANAREEAKAPLLEP